MLGSCSGSIAPNVKGLAGRWGIGSTTDAQRTKDAVIFYCRLYNRPPHCRQTPCKAQGGHKKKNMSPEEKAKELIGKFTENFPPDFDIARERAKDYATILCQEIIDYVGEWDRENEMEFNEDGGHVEFWEMVKSEIECQ